MREIRTAGSISGLRKRAPAQRACAPLYCSHWLVSTHFCKYGNVFARERSLTVAALIRCTKLVKLANRNDVAQHAPMLDRGHPGNVSVRWNRLNHDRAQ